MCSNHGWSLQSLYSVSCSSFSDIQNGATQCARQIIVSRLTIRWNTAAPSDEDLIIQDIASVQEELSRWKALGIMTDEDEIEDFDLVRFWQVSISLFPCYNT